MHTQKVVGALVLALGFGCATVSPLQQGRTATQEEPAPREAVTGEAVQEELAAEEEDVPQPDAEMLAELPPEEASMEPPLDPQEQEVCRDRPITGSQRVRRVCLTRREIQRGMDEAQLEMRRWQRGTPRMRGPGL